MSTAPAAALASAASAYGFHCVLTKQDFSQAIVDVTEALKTEGFGILTDIDVQATMKANAPIASVRQRIKE